MNNHNASVFQVDDHVLLDHAFYKGLYLAVIDRRDLSIVETGFYNTSTSPGLVEFGEVKGKEKQVSNPWIYHGDFETIDDFAISR